MEDLLLIPKPKEFHAENQKVIIDHSWEICPGNEELDRISTKLQLLLKEQLNLNLEINKDLAVKEKQFHLVIDDRLSDQEYELSITENKCMIKGGTEQAVHYGFVTLKQIILQQGNYIKVVRIKDWPDFAQRGVMHDIGRMKIPKIETIYRMIDILSDLKVNQFQLYVEGYCIESDRYKEYWPEATPLTKEEVRSIDQYARDHYIELIPNQNCFGHMGGWLKKDQFKHLSEITDEHEAFPGFKFSASTLDPSDPGSLELVANIWDELLPLFNSDMVNINFDEPFELGKGKSKSLAEQLGLGQVYVDFLLKVYDHLTQQGKKVMLWGDVLLNYPEVLPQLPKDITLLDWGYDSENDTFEAHGETLRNSGIDFYFCPGTSAWHSLAGRTDNMMENIENAVHAGLKYGAKGILNTDWGDVHGHWRYLPISYAGMVYGAQLSWNAENKGKDDLAKYLDRFIFKDKNEQVGNLVLDLGNYYHLEGVKWHDQTLTYMAYTMGLLDKSEEEERLRKSLDALIEIFDVHLLDESALNYVYDFEGMQSLMDDLRQRLKKIDLQTDDRELIIQELNNTIRFVEHGAKLKELIHKSELQTPEHVNNMKEELEDMLSIHESLWMHRNKPGGYSDSRKPFVTLIEQYNQMIEKIGNNRRTHQ